MPVLSFEPGAHHPDGFLVEQSTSGRPTVAKIPTLLDRLYLPMTWCTYHYFWNPLTLHDRFFHYPKPIMAGAQFEYDEKGTTFYYFLISFYGIVLVPVTYYVWNVTKLPGELNLSPVVHKTTISSFRRESQLFNSNRATSRFFSMIFCQITFQMIRKERLKSVDVHRA